MQKKIVKVTAVHMGSVHIDFEDGTMMVIHRDAAKKGVPKVGDLWPPEDLPPAPEFEEAVKVAGFEDEFKEPDPLADVVPTLPDDPKKEESNG
jgi:hypothetical protein